MSAPLLATKLYIPPARSNVVPRAHLIARLDTALSRALTLISAPAGFGNTTLLSAWLFERMKDEGRRMKPGSVVDAPPSSFIPHPSSFAWLSLDAADSDPARFLTYLVAALQTLDATVGAGVVGLLQSPQPPPLEALLTALLNAIAALPGRLVLALDDYHVLDSPAVDEALAFLIEHLPPQLHLVIATREDPHLPLARLRARGQPTELRASDLRFTPVEAAEFLTQVMGLNLADGWQVGSAYLSVLEHSEMDGAARDHGRVMFNFETPEVQAEFERIRGLGAAIIAAPYELGGGWIATLADPDGNYFQLVTPMG